MLKVVGPYQPGLGDGDPDSALVGTGVAYPPGIESVLEYNGLLLNIQKNRDRYRITSIDGLGDADVRDSRDVNTEDHGETPYNAFYGGRTIVISGTIQAYSVSKMRDMWLALRTAFNDLTTERPLHFRSGEFASDLVIYCKKLSPIQYVDQQTTNMPQRDFQVTLRASNPVFLSYYAKFASAAPIINLEGYYRTLFTCENTGNWEARPIIRVYGSCSEERILNSTTNEEFIIGPIVEGDWVEMDMSTKIVVNSSGQNSWSVLNDASDYLTIAPGEPNQFWYRGDSPQITMTWHDTWL